jgi:hypothetical protein
MRIATAFWSLVLGGSVLAIALGFLGGRRFATALQPQPRPLARLAVPPLLDAVARERTLRGANSLDAGPDDPDRYGDVDDAVATRPAGSGSSRYDARTDVARVAIVAVEPERSASALPALVAEPFPLAVVVPPDDAGGALELVRAGGKGVLVNCAGADLGAIARLRSDGAAGIACSTADPARARALVAANGSGLVFDDLLDGRSLYRAARAERRPALTRDLIVDARDDPPYVEFLFAQALAIAHRSGSATVALHVRDDSRRALERFAARAERERVRIVPLASLAG